MRKIANDRELDTPLTVDEIRTFLDSAFPFFSKKWTDGENNERRWLGNNYTDEEERKIRSGGRQPYSFGQARMKIQRIVGIQESQRTQFNILSSFDPNDEIKAELAKMQIHAVEKRSNFQNVETSIFTKGLAVKFGVTKRTLDYTNIYPRVKVEEVDWRNFMWDINSIKYDIFEDALWWCEIDNEYRKFVEQKYGYRSKLVSELTEGQFSTFEGRQKLSYYVRENNVDNNYDIISLFNFYIKTPRKYWYVIFPDTEGISGNTNVIESKHRTKKAAETRLRELQSMYLLQGLPIEGNIESRDELGIDKYVATYDKILEHEETDEEKANHNVYRSIHLGNDFCSFMDLLRDPQKWYDRFIMQIDYALGKDNKVAKQLNVTKLAESETPSSALQKIEEGKTILTKSSEQVLQAIQMNSLNPGWLQMIDLLLMVFEDLSGGQQFNAKANANDSGRKVDSLINQGNLTAKPFLDNLRQWKVADGERTLEWMRKYETAEDVMKIQGGALTPEMVDLLTKNNLYRPSPANDGTGYVTINQEGNELSYLKDASFELEVTEESMSDSERHAQLLLATEQEKINPMLLQSPTWQEYKLGLMDISTSIKYKLLTEIKQAQQAQNQVAQESAALEKRKVDIEAAKVISGSPQGTFASA